LAPGSKVWGTPAHDLRTALKEIALVQRLPEIVGRLDALERVRKPGPKRTTRRAKRPVARRKKRDLA
jgi:hypothetical protein